MITLDFETEGIRGNPTVRPPRPVGLAYKLSSAPGKYLAWGHPGQNGPQAESALAQAKQIVGEAIERKERILFHNSKFDIAVMGEHLDIPIPPSMVDDTLYQIFLHDPYADTFSLKPSSERILGWAPEEQNDLRDWIVRNLHVSEKEWGAYIAQAPVEKVQPYAIGDVDRTFALHEKLRPTIPSEAYERELKLRPILDKAERRGIRVNVELLDSDLFKYETTLFEVDNKIFGMLDGTEFNLGSGDELAEALDRAKKVTEWKKTPTGRKSTARKNLLEMVNDKELASLLAYRGALAHCLSNFYRPWAQLCDNSPSGDRMHPEWNQVRQMRGETNDTKGTRTGRLSCTNPNFQNPPNEYELTIPPGLPDLPLMRKYILPEKGRVWYKRDYSQQELRILAHYSEGRLYSAYRENPRIDAHETGQALIRSITGKQLIRKHVKITGFSMIYGSGVAKLAVQLGVPTSEAAQIKAAYLQAFPEVKDLMDNCQNRGRAAKTIKTWGGREYKVEPPKIVKGTYRSYEYKLLNYLIQGSAADCTKEAIIRWDSDPGDGEFLCTVHDEININGNSPGDMIKLKNAMESIEFDVEMLSDGYEGQTWSNLTKCD